MTPNVAIVLSTYNGGKRIIKQLDSIVSQTYKNVTLFIRDDGSTDDTREIVEKYISNNSCDISIIYLREHNNLGYPMSFYRIIRLIDIEDYDYISFCDQDDFWYPNKIEKAVNILTEVQYRDDIPLLYYSSCEYRDDEYRYIKKSVKQHNNLKLHEVIYHTPGSGFTIVINRETARRFILEHTPGMEYHDRYLIRCVVCFGKVIYDDEITAVHIRYNDSVTSGDASSVKLIFNYINNELLGNNIYNEKKSLRHFCRIYWKDLDERQKALLYIFATNKKSVSIWIKKIFFPKRMRRRFVGDIALRFIFLFGRL